MGYTGSATAEDKKAKLVAQREYLKKKKAKKAERYKEMEQKTEAAKSSWQNFSTKGRSFCSHSWVLMGFSNLFSEAALFLTEVLIFKKKQGHIFLQNS